MKDIVSDFRSLVKFIENKDHLIKRLNLTDEQKTKLIDLFKKYPNLESKIDWNRKDLNWPDFQEVLTSEGKSRSQAKKKGIEGLKEGEDYKLLEKNENYTVYYPLTHLGSKILADKVAPVDVIGQWCISENEATWWNKYTSNGTDFFFIFTADDKYAVARTANQKNWIGTENSIVVFNAEDTELSPNEVRKTFSQEPFGNNVLRSSVEETLPYQLDQKYPYNRNEWFKSLPSGEYSKNGSKLIILNVDQPEIKIEPGTKIIDAQFPRPENTIVKTINIPPSVNIIGKRAFQDLTKISQVHLPLDCDIGEFAFQDCTELIAAASSFGKWPSNEIQANTFNGCKNLRYIPLSDNVRDIGICAFAKTGSRIPELVLPETLTIVRSQAFYKSEFKKITLPSTFIEFGSDVFADSKVEILNVNGQVRIPPGAFRSCKQLKTISGWNDYKMTGIEDLAFSGCSGLIELDFSQSGGIYIEGKSFANCKALTTVRFPKSTAISWNSFQDSPNLKDFYYPDTIEKWKLCRKDLDKNFPAKQLISVDVHCTDGTLHDAVSYTT